MLSRILNIIAWST